MKVEQLLGHQLLCSNEFATFIEQLLAGHQLFNYCVPTSNEFDSSHANGKFMGPKITVLKSTYTWRKPNGHEHSPAVNVMSGK